MGQELDLEELSKKKYEVTVSKYREDGKCCWGCKYYSTNDATGNCSKKKVVVKMHEYCEKFKELW